MDDQLRHMVESAARGSRPDVEALLQRYLPGLRAFIRVRAGPSVRARESASDLAQSVCREVLQHIDRFQYGSEAGFRHWLFTTALRRIQNKHEFHRAQKRDVKREVPLQPTGPPDASVAELGVAYRTFSSPSGHAMAREELARIESAFDELSEDDREVITLSRLVGLSHAEIAERTGRSAGATRVALHRALARLARLLDTEEET